MQEQQLIQFLAAMSNGRARERFARIALGHHEGVAADPAADSLLGSARVIEELPDGRVRVDEAGLRALLDQARSSLPPRPEPKLEQLPRHAGQRVAALRDLAERILAIDESVREPELNARLGEFVTDVPRVRRAMVDDGVLARERDGSSYWRSPLPSDGSQGTP
ncbi:DUF2087 domain-containing protein [Sinomonas sp. JGH33]|uniref:DUF2087 domain-containing protein n=1 Tax=Sinomonas terricola TaxID=3110330 RepID=A0ABU5TA49_9MICC|nr:DUF2087 domain-containing protein [Sinomonas sp. JGH33]MEA5456458.1 DUF2087 domain-containing protein [Sinomonas sp. JGH33]